ncbi:MAG: mannose-6-phosphate isomerase, class I [Lentisphaeria bacterium]|nr:mannose-6-phosphate isomerase, class I [Lentisphaeria bacterium]
MFHTFIPIKCHIQHYPWGGRARGGVRPYIAELTGMEAEEGEPFAELWIGAHPKLPALAMLDGEKIPLDKLIAVNQRAILGDRVLAAGFDSLPFLLKILDCDQPLSIQAHPDLNRAAELHARDPEHYPDANHKPEIAIGITGMTAFCQFRPAADISADIDRLPALKSFLGDAGANERTGGKDWLRALYGRLFSASDAEVAATLAELEKAVSVAVPRNSADEWFTRLAEFYPGDRGLLSAFFLNVVDIGAEEGVFLGPNEPHAYLKGTIVECMASSDNVVRAGLTPKFIDREALVEMITCEMGRPKVNQGETLAAGEKVYKVPVPEFQVEVYTHGAGVSRGYASDGAVSILLVLDGEAVLRCPEGEYTAPRGSAWLWPAELDAAAIDYVGDTTKIIRARPNVID